MVVCVGFLPCERNIVTNALLSTAYTLQVTFTALDWMALMNAFQFSVEIYIMFFVAVGICSVVQGVRDETKNDPISQSTRHIYICIYHWTRHLLHTT
jgi:hypothetical protein